MSKTQLEKDLILGLIKAISDSNPELRIGQIIGNILRTTETSELYYMNNSEFAERLMKYLEDTND